MLGEGPLYLFKLQVSSSICYSEIQIEYTIEVTKVFFIYQRPDLDLTYTA